MDLDHAGRWTYRWCRPFGKRLLIKNTVQICVGPSYYCILFDARFSRAYPAITFGLQPSTGMVSTSMYNTLYVAVVFALMDVRFVRFARCATSTIFLTLFMWTSDVGIVIMAITVIACGFLDYFSRACS